MGKSADVLICADACFIWTDKLLLTSD